MTSSSGGPSGPGPGISVGYDQHKLVNSNDEEKEKKLRSSLSDAQSSAWMEKLRNKSGSLKSLQDLSKNVRAALLDRRQLGALDGEDKAVLRKTLDVISESIPVKGASSMAERLEAIARKMGRNPENGQNKLSFMEARAHGCYFLSTEMFYVEINIDSESGTVKDAKIHHIDSANGQTAQTSPTAQQNCIEIMQCLNNGDFGRFIKHLEGLMMVYDLKGGQNISAPQKSIAWNALSILERDLETLYNTYRNWTSTSTTFIHNTPLGLLKPRTGGISMQLRYFLSPYHLLMHSSSHKKNGVNPMSSKQELEMTLEEIAKQENIGYSATIGIEVSPMPNLLPTGSLYSMNKQLGGILDPIPLGPNNSVSLMVRYALKFDHPIPLSVSNLRQISELTEIHHEALSSDKKDHEKPQPLLELIIKNCSDEQLNPSNNRGLFVTLPDQQHCYFLSDHNSLKGISVSSIPFQHPSQVPEILLILRQQALFNTLIESCARSKSIQDLESSIMFEVSATDTQALTITFEVPTGITASGSMGYEEAMMSVQLDLSSNVEVKSTIFASSSEVCPESFLDNAIQRSLSIPVSMRSIIAFCQMKRLKEESIIQKQDIEQHQQPNLEDPISGIKLEPLSDSNVDFKFNTDQSLEGDQKMDARNGNSNVSSSTNQFLQQQNQVLMDEENNIQHLQTPGDAPMDSDSFQQTEIKSEPMEFEVSGHNDSNGKNFSQTSSHSLNAFGPQDTTFPPGASVQKKVGTAGIINSNLEAIASRKDHNNLLKNHQMEKNVLELLSKKNLTEQRRLMEVHASRKISDTKKDRIDESLTNNNKGHKSHQIISSSGNHSGKKTEGSKLTLQGTNMPQNVKPSVSITPVSSSHRNIDITSGNGLMTNEGNLLNKKGIPSSGGIEIIPLGHHHGSGHHSSSHHSSPSNDKSGTKSPKNPKDLPRRSLSENDSMSSSSSSSKKKLSKAGGGNGSSHSSSNSSNSNKKIRHGTDLEKKLSKSGDKKHGSTSSLKRSSHSLSPVNHGGKSAKLSSSLSIAKVSNSQTSPQLSSTTGGIEIIPSISGTNLHSSTSKSQQSSSLSYNKDKSNSSGSKSSSGGLKVTIKSSYSSSSDGKARSDHRGTGSSGSNLNSGSGSSGISKSKSGGSPSGGHSGNSSTQKPRSSASSSSSSSQSQQKHSSLSDKDRQRERERQQRNKAERLEKEKLSNEKKAEEVRRILSGGKPLTTFQIPKLSSSSSAIKSDDYVMMTSSAKASGEIPVSQGSKSANASPKYHGVSPKYGGGMPFNTSSNMSGSKSVNTSPKLTSGNSPKLASVSPKSGNFVLPNSSASPRYIGGGSVTPPNVSPKHSMTAPSAIVGGYSSTNSSNQNNKSSPNYASHNSNSSSEQSNSQKKLSASSSRSPHSSTQGQSTHGALKTNSVFSIGHSGKSEGSTSGSNSSSKYSSPTLSLSSTTYPNSNRNQTDQTLLGITSDSGNFNTQPNKLNENAKPTSQTSTVTSNAITGSKEAASEKTEKAIVLNSTSSTNIVNHTPEKSAMMSLMEDISGQ